jgi:type II secretion system protein H
MSEIGCNNKKLQKGFTLIEILVVLIIIGISTTLITLNFSTLKSIDSQGNSFEKTVNFLTEESIVTGNIIGWYLNSNKQFAEYINEIASLKKTFRFEDGTLVEIEEISNESPLMIFYPSGENSGGEIDIYHNDFIQRIVIKSNGKVINETISY